MGWRFRLDVTNDNPPSGGKSVRKWALGLIGIVILTISAFATNDWSWAQEFLLESLQS